MRARGDRMHLEATMGKEKHEVVIGKKDSAWDSASKDQSEISLSSSLIGHATLLVFLRIW